MQKLKQHSVALSDFSAKDESSTLAKLGFFIACILSEGSTGVCGNNVSVQFICSTSNSDKGAHPLS